MKDIASQLTVEQARQQGVKYLCESRPEQVESLVDWGLAHCLGLSRGTLLAQRARDLSADEIHQWTTLLDGLRSGSPLQYLTGETQFMDFTLGCDPRALIPRPETEQLVEWMLGDSRLWKHPEPRLADVGTGTGCIILALARAHPDAALWAVDLSADALDLARENAQRLGLTDHIQWMESNGTEDLKGEGLHAIVSNPPYIEDAAWTDLEPSVRKHEPRLALTSGPDGLDCIRELIEQAPACLVPGGLLYMEIGEQQETAIRTMLEQNHFQTIEFRQDLAGRTRMLRAEVGNE